MESKTKKPAKQTELTLAPAGEPLTDIKNESTYDGGFHVAPVKTTRLPNQRVISKRSALQTFTC